MGLIADSLKELISAFDSEQGVSDKVYYAPKNIIWHLLGEESTQVFARNIDATDCYYYTNMNGEELVRKVFEARDF